ncbi:MAG: 50S ribosomal protein L11 methyltransferase [Alphaproteobacteria bacterium]|nr:MAG: 50S ribosomal protein L11 methyltransferase [Alphaproteobacteria bacterium]
MTSWKIKLSLARELIPVVQEIIYGLDGNNCPTLSDFEIEDGHNIRSLEAFFIQKPDLKLFRERLASILPSFDLSLSGITLLEIKQKDWVSESQKLLQPVDTGLFFIYGSHDAHRIPDNRISLLVEAGQAFGTGQHETTHGCLLAIGELAEDLTGDDKNPQTALDLGCGSGLLALAMCKVWPITIVASDIDPIATGTTILNAAANRVPVVGLKSGDTGIAVLTSDGFEDNELGQAGPYDVIVANILAKPLQDMAPDIVENLSGGGSLILSGLLGTQEKAVCAAYAKEGMTLVRRYVRGEWHSLMLQHTA